jgi:hypothetical protein
MSRQSTPLLTLSLVASGAVAANRFVTPLNALAGAGANSIGVNRAAAADTERMAVDALGTTTITSGAAFSAGDTLKSDGSGKAITWVTSGAKIAIALEAATGADQLIEVLLIPNAA